MLIRILLVLSYIFWCCRFRAAPWRYFQLNANYFNEQRKLFSKLDMDKLIPMRWRLQQYVDQAALEPDQFPVFVKPEWGQNSQGVCRIDNLEQLNEHRQQRRVDSPRYLIQSAAKQQREFEIFYIPESKIVNSAAILSVTETGNHSAQLHPVNGIYNKQTFYTSCMQQLSETHLSELKKQFTSIGQFKIARYCARADSIEALVAGEFSIVEINVYLPMPLMLLADNLSYKVKLNFLFNAMKQLALVTKDIPASQVIKPVFFRKLQCSRLLKACLKNELSS